MSKAPKQKLSLNPAPTFKAVVQIPMRNGESSPVEFTFKHRTKDEFKAFADSLKAPEVEDGAEPEDGRKDVDVLLDIASAWDLEEAFDAKSLEKLIQNYMGSAQAIITTYFTELTGARVKNS